MLESLSLAGLSAGAKYLVQEVVGPLVKGAAEDFCKDFLKKCVSDGLAQAAPAELKKAIAKSLKEFLVLFQGELENCGLPGELVHHEFAAPLKGLLKDTEVRQFLGEAFDTDTQHLSDSFLAVKWAGLGCDSLPTDFDWAQLTKNYVRRVKGLIRADAELSKQLQLDYEERTAASTAEILGVRVDFDLRKYQEALKKKFGRLSLDSLDTTAAAYDNLRLWKVFVAQDVRECAEFAPQMYELPKELQAAGKIDPLMPLDVREQRHRAYAEKPVESVSDVVGLNGTHSALRAVILGDPGSGKSTLLRAIALSWAEKPRQALQNEPIPILIELRLYARDKDAKKCNNFLEYLHKGNTIYHLNQLKLDALLKEGRVVALFDGIDEVFDPIQREEVVNDINRFSIEYETVQMVVTSRWLGYEAETLRNAGFKHYRLQDLNEDQIEDFLVRWHDATFTAAQIENRERKQARLQKAIRESRAIRELADNPLLLTLMAILNLDQELPMVRAQLYEQASKVLLHQWDVKVKRYEHPELKGEGINEQDKKAMLQKVAHYMQSNEEGLSGNIISRENLERILTNYLKMIEVRQSRVLARTVIEQLQERNFILCCLDADNYAFVHRTFLEYFCASEFVYQFEKERTLDIRVVAK